MWIFIDSGDVSEIQRANELGLINGVNFSSVAQKGNALRSLILEIAEIIDGPIHLGVTGTSLESILKGGRELASWQKDIVLKIPLSEEGLKAARVFAGEEIKTNVTFCSSPLQALLAAKAGAAYISPVAELDDTAPKKMALTQAIRLIFDNYGFETQIMTSVASASLMQEAAQIGTDAITVPFSLIKQLLHRP